MQLRHHLPRLFWRAPFRPARRHRLLRTSSPHRHRLNRQQPRLLRRWPLSPLRRRLANRRPRRLRRLQRGCHLRPVAVFRRPTPRQDPRPNPRQSRDRGRISSRTRSRIRSRIQSPTNRPSLQQSFCRCAAVAARPDKLAEVCVRDVCHSMCSWAGRYAPGHLLTRRTAVQQIASTKYRVKGPGVKLKNGGVIGQVRACVLSNLKKALDAQRWVPLCWHGNTTFLCVTICFTAEPRRLTVNVCHAVLRRWAPSPSRF